MQSCLTIEVVTVTAPSIVAEPSNPTWRPFGRALEAGCYSTVTSSVSGPRLTCPMVVPNSTARSDQNKEKVSNEGVTHFVLKNQFQRNSTSVYSDRGLP